MMAGVLGWANWLVLGALPGWGWLVIGSALALAALVLTPEVPGYSKARYWLAASVLLACMGVSLKSWGYAQGEAHSDAKWQRQVNVEKARLAAGFQQQLLDERTRTDAATQANATLQQERDDALKAIPTQQVDANGSPAASDADVVIPPGVAAKLYAIGSRRGNGSP